jgi:SAM-dependent methyltransferase
MHILVCIKKETTMTLSHEKEDEQAAAWNGRAGRAWVEAQEPLDRMFEPFETLLLDAVRAEAPERVLDVGCGTGATTLAVARQLAGAGGSTGIDISEPMIAVARARAERAGAPVTFIRANAQHHAFEPARFDMLISRFGVMFFDDPVRAFANLRQAARTGAALRAVVWRSADENSFMTTAERAAAPLLPDLPPRRPGAPGQFALADRHRVRAILAESGWGDIDVQPLDVACTLSEADLVQYVTRLGPVGQALSDADERTRAQVTEVVRAAFASYVHGAVVRFTAACWMVGARVP